MNIYTISSLTAFLISFFLALFVYGKGSHNKSQKAIMPIILCAGIWCLFPFIAAIGGSKNALLFTRLVYIAAVFTAPVFLNFGLTVLDLEKIAKERNLIRLSFLTSTFLFLPFLFSTLFIKNVLLFRPYFSVKGGPIYFLFILFFGIVCLYCFYKIYLVFQQSMGFRKNQLKYIFIGFLLAFLSGLMHFSTAFNIPEFFPHDFLVVACMFILIYSIIRYRLLNIKVAVTRAGLFILMYTLVLGIPFALAVVLKPWLSAIIGLNWWVVPLGVMAVLATTGPFLYIYLDRKAEEKLFKEQKRYQNTLKQASLGMTRIRDLRKLLKLIVYIVTKTVRISHTSIYLLDKENSHFKMEAIRDGQKRVTPDIETDSILVGWLKTEREPIVIEELKRRIQDTPQEALKRLNEEMISLNASLIVPSFIEDKLLGFMVLGDKRSGEIYSEDDLRVFTVLANQAALAIDNARFFEDAKEMQDQISQAEKMATIGTMADGLSHQINNRFHALSLIAGDTMDTIKLTDINNYSKEQKDLVAQISHALERIQANVIQGGEIVKGMLKYTRKGEEGLAAVALDNIIDSTLEMVQYKVRLSDIDIVRDYPKDTPTVRGNLTQLQEVFFNIVDNAYYAMIERRDILKEKDYRGKIRIYAKSLENGYLSITIEDNGIGVKPENLKKMFTPFFTTKASSHKGTGLGLYVIKKIITSHNGKISVESTHGQGTKFIIELPFAAEHAQSKRAKTG